MQAARPTLFWLLATASAFAADDPPANPAAPQPRPRLEQPTAGTTKSTARPAADTAPELPAHHPIIVMEKYTVRDSPVAGGRPQAVTPDPGKFSLLNGGFSQAGMRLHQAGIAPDGCGKVLHRFVHFHAQ